MAFECRVLNVEFIYNGDKTYFSFNMNDGRNIEFREDQTVKYANVESGV